MKYNTDGKRGGEFIVWINDELVLHEANVANRHDSNKNEFDFISFGDYSKVNSEHPWSLWYDNIQIMRDIPEELKAGLNGEPDPEEEVTKDYAERTVPNAAWVYCDDFENQRKVSDYYYKNNDFATKLSKLEGNGIDRSYGLQSTFAKQYYPYGGGYRFAFGKTPVALTSTVLGNSEEPIREFYFRTYVKNADNWTGSENGRLFYFQVLNDSNAAVARVSLEYASGVLYSFVQPAKFNEAGKPITYSIANF